MDARQEIWYIHTIYLNCVQLNFLISSLVHLVWNKAKEMILSIYTGFLQTNQSSLCYVCHWPWVPSTFLIISPLVPHHLIKLCRLALPYNFCQLWFSSANFWSPGATRNSPALDLCIPIQLALLSHWIDKGMHGTALLLRKLTQNNEERGERAMFTTIIK